MSHEQENEKNEPRLPIGQALLSMGVLSVLAWVLFIGLCVIFVSIVGLI